MAPECYGPEDSCFSFIHDHTVLMYPMGKVDPDNTALHWLPSVLLQDKGGTCWSRTNLLQYAYFPSEQNGLGNIWLGEALDIFKFLPLGTSPSPALSSLPLPPGDRRQGVEGTGFIRHNLTAGPVRLAAKPLHSWLSPLPNSTPILGQENPNFQVPWALSVLANIV